ncbi:hypothetical protein HIM_01422 [Hirsutella minnesotensis 3608]|nr:hypothetical protein HIM_01422 [Hirsutella minnesotensis 3608]
MPPHLHPRSRMTSSLFATTVVASFFVVALPHLLPCPVPRTKFADGDVVVDDNGRRRIYRRREPAETEVPRAGGGIVQFGQGAIEEAGDAAQRTRRECPVPKPRGVLGEWLGVRPADDTGRRRQGQED